MENDGDERPGGCVNFVLLFGLGVAMLLTILLCAFVLGWVAPHDPAMPQVTPTTYGYPT